MNNNTLIVITIYGCKLVQISDYIFYIEKNINLVIHKIRCKLVQISDYIFYIEKKIISHDSQNLRMAMKMINHSLTQFMHIFRIYYVVAQMHGNMGASKYFNRNSRLACNSNQKIASTLAKCAHQQTISILHEV